MILRHSYREPMREEDNFKDWAAIGMILFATLMLLALPIFS